MNAFIEQSAQEVNLCSGTKGMLRSMHHLREFFAYKAKRTMHPTKDGRPTKRPAQMTVLARINDRQHKTAAMTAPNPRNNVPLRMTGV